jgi:hypothetical protein
MYTSILKLAKLFEKYAIRSVIYDPKTHQQLKDYEKDINPEDRFGEAKEYAQTKKFDIEHFSSITNPMEARLYAHRRLQMLGQGSSRAVYVYSPKYALKIATNPAGIAQNRLEHNISEDSKYNEIIAKVINADPDYKWVISELVNPIYYVDSDDYNEEIKEKEEFAKYSPAEFDTLMQGIDSKYSPAYLPGSGYKAFPQYRKIIKKHPKSEEIKRKVKLVQELINDWGLNFSDIAVPSNWGRTADGRVVILDFGYDEGIRKDFYSKSQPKNWVVDPLEHGSVILPQDTTMKEYPHKN